MIERFSYSVFSTVLGMAVVFMALAVLSLLMVALKRAFGRTGARARAAGKPPAGGQAAATPPRWLPAAVAAYLALLEAERYPLGGGSAEVWKPDITHYDPWLAGPPNRGVGI